MIPAKFNQGIGRFRDKCANGLVEKSFVTRQFIAIAQLRGGTGSIRFSSTLGGVVRRSSSTHLSPGGLQGIRNEHLG